MVTIDMGRKEGAAVPLSRRAGTLSSYYNVAWAEVYFRTKWRLHSSSRLATINLNRKLGAVPLLGGAATPSNTKSPRLTDVYLRTKWHLDTSSRLATIDMGQKLGGVGVPFSGGSWVPIEHKVA